MSELFSCKKTNKYILFACEDSSCDWYLNSHQFCNCTFIAAYFGPFTNSEVGAMIGLSGERVRQIEEHAIEKLKRMKERGRIVEPVIEEEPEFILPEYPTNLF